MFEIDEVICRIHQNQSQNNVLDGQEYYWVVHQSVLLRFYLYEPFHIVSIVHKQVFLL